MWFIPGGNVIMQFLPMTKLFFFMSAGQTSYEQLKKHTHTHTKEVQRDEKKKVKEG